MEINICVGKANGKREKKIMADGCGNNSNKNILNFTFDIIALLLPSVVLCLKRMFSCFLLCPLMIPFLVARVFAFSFFDFTRILRIDLTTQSTDFTQQAFFFFSCCFSAFFLFCYESILKSSTQTIIALSM